jgi:D-alanyl-D-alanine carboxypeptidase (penicillin-binding protein 5/6)
VTAPDAAEATASDEPVAAVRDPRSVADPTALGTDVVRDDEPAETVLDRTDAADRGAASAVLADADPLVVDPEPATVPDDLDALAAEAASAQWADDRRPATALTWVDPATVADGTAARGFDQPVDTSGAALLRGARLRPAIARPSVWGPFALLLALTGSYAGTTLLWPLHEVAPTITAAEVTPVAAPAAAPVWPAQGSAAIGVGGMTTAASNPEAASIASITKVVSSLMVLDRMPLAPGEQGPAFSFTRADSQSYWSYRRSDQSALDVPVGGTLTEYQLLQGTLLGSANNYIDRLATEIWGSRAAFAEAAEVWLRERGLADITIVTPSGFDEGNTASPEALVRLGELAMENPVFAEIVGTPSVELPGAGVVTNTNGMLADPGVVGIKTGTLVGWNLLTAKDVTIDDTTVRLYAAVLNQDDDDQRLAATRSLFAEVEAALAAQDAAVPEGTVVGQVQTEWGEEVDIVTDADADVVLWNGAVATASVSFDLGDERTKGGAVGSLSATGPLNSATTQLSLASDVDGPSPWWRLTHPIELFGIDAD